ASAFDPRWFPLRLMAASRVAVALGLSVLLSIDAAPDPGDWLADPALFARAAGAYLVAAVALLVVTGRLRKHLDTQLAVQALTDLVALSVMMHAAGALRGGLGVLMVAAVAAAAVLSTRLMALFFAAAASLLLLGEAVMTGLQNGDFQSSLPMIAGLIGAACFVTAMLINWLATQLRRQEELAQARGEDLRNQLAVTQRVVAELEQGVLVLAPDGQVRAMNPAARRLLGVDPEAAAIDPAHTPGLAAVARACAAWRAAGAPGGKARDLLLPVTAENPVRLLLHCLATPGGDSVLMLEDPRRVEARAQHLKLASMGRLSASIAHEIRNPLGAIRHANALLSERLDDASARRLSRIIEDNTLRIDRVIGDVLSVSRRDRPGDETISMGPFLSAFADEFVAQAGVERGRIALDIESWQAMRFDSNHLRQVLVNLVGNALRYASGTPGSVVVAWRQGARHRLELRVPDDGTGLSAEMQQHAFEPFFTTETRGTGLGLYLARELCVANGAALRFEPAAEGRPGAFVIEPRADLAP
ncbi:MAG: sensor histidine kinase, partial [Gammaproteobacteria bacterium]